MDSGTPSLLSALLPAIIGLTGVFASIPFNALFAWYLKRDEQNYQLKLNTILERRKKDLYQQIEKRDADIVILRKDVDEIKTAIKELWRRNANG